MNQNHPRFYRLFCFFSYLALFYTLFVASYGAYVRLTDAGLGCPDWPGCYGQLKIPEVEHAQEFTGQESVDFDKGKAAREMRHRYLVGPLSLLYVALFVWSFFLGKGLRCFTWLRFSVLLVVVGQAVLGMLTVTLKVHPVVVLAHLLGGILLIALNAWVSFAQASPFFNQVKKRFSQMKPIGAKLRWLGVISVFILVLQISSGGWVSANYAALACPDFPQCRGEWVPAMDFGEGFSIPKDFKQNYEGGQFADEARVAIHWVHRLGFVLVTVILLILIWNVLKKYPPLRKFAGLVLLCLIAQITLGISNVVFSLPLFVAVFHHLGAGLLLVSLLLLVYFLFQPQQKLF